MTYRIDLPPEPPAPPPPYQPPAPEREEPDTEKTRLLKAHPDLQPREFRTVEQKYVDVLSKDMQVFYQFADAEDHIWVASAGLHMFVLGWCHLSEPEAWTICVTGSPDYLAMHDASKLGIVRPKGGFVLLDSPKAMWFQSICETAFDRWPEVLQRRHTARMEALRTALAKR